MRNGVYGLCTKIGDLMKSAQKLTKKEIEMEFTNRIMLIGSTTMGAIFFTLYFIGWKEVAAISVPIYVFIIWPFFYKKLEKDLLEDIIKSQKKKIFKKK